MVREHDAQLRHIFVTFASLDDSDPQRALWDSVRASGTTIGRTEFMLVLLNYQVQTAGWQGCTPPLGLDGLIQLPASLSSQALWRFDCVADSLFPLCLRRSFLCCLPNMRHSRSSLGIAARTSKSAQTPARRTRCHSHPSARCWRQSPSTSVCACNHTHTCVWQFEYLGLNSSALIKPLC